MNSLSGKTRRIGTTDVRVGRLGFGGVPLGNLYRSWTTLETLQTVQTAASLGVDYFDTAPLYGFGLSERRLGLALPEANCVDPVVSTKVGRTLYPLQGQPADHGIFVDAPPFGAKFDFSYGGIMRQVEDSLQRLGRDRVDCLVIHDLGLWHMQTRETLGQNLGDLKNGGLRALTELRRSGVVRAIGAGANELTLCRDFIDMPEVDFILLALRYTLLDQTAFPEILDMAVAAQTSIVLGAPFQSGILATGAGRTGKMNYADADPDSLSLVRRIEEICQNYSVPLKAAALQFPLHHPAVISVLAGMATPTEVQQNVSAMEHAIPGEFWESLKSAGLLNPLLPTSAMLGST